MGRKIEQLEDGQYSTVQVAEISGVSVSQLQYWAHEGLLVPGVRQAVGQGSRRVYSFNDLLHLRFIVKLKHSGWSTQKIRRALQVFRELENDPNPLGSAILLGERGMLLAVFKTKSGEQVLLDALTSGRQFVLDIVWETLADETRRALSESK